MPNLNPGGAEPHGRPNASSQRSPKAIIASTYRQHRDLLRNTASLYAAFGITSILGLLYWTVAARLFSQQDVGYGAAEVSAMTLLGTIGTFGLGTLLVGELPKRERRTELVSAALMACALGSLLLGLGFVLIAPLFSGRFAPMIGTLNQKALFVVGVVLTGLSIAFDLATIGVLRGGIQLARNMAFSLLKLSALPILAFVLHDRLGFDITFAWVIGLALSFVFVAARMALSGIPLLVRPDWSLLRSLGRTAMAHNWINVSVTVAPTIFPVLVTVLISPSANAAFYVAFTLSTLIYMIPTHLGTVLFAMAAGEPHSIAYRLRFGLKLSYIIGLPAVAILILGGHRILSVYGPGYARNATLPLCLLTLGYIPSVPKMLYMAISRANGRIAQCAAVLTVFTFLEIGAVALGALSDGLIGLSLALLVTLTVQGIATTPPVLRAVMSDRRHSAYRFHLFRQQY